MLRARTWKLRGAWWVETRGVHVPPILCTCGKGGVRGQREGGCTKERGDAPKRRGAHPQEVACTNRRRHTQGRGMAMRGQQTPFVPPCSHAPFACKGVGGAWGAWQ